MRANRSGRIVNVTSMVGKVYAALGAWYCASKFARRRYRRPVVTASSW